MKKYFWFTVIGSLLSLTVNAQLPSNKVKPGEMYQAGDTVHSPRLGLTTRIPEGWTGVMPREMEVFLLMPETNIAGEIYVVVNYKTDLEGQQTRWEKGITMEEQLRLQPDGQITTRGPGVIATTAKLVGQNANEQARAYLEAKCSPAGFCVCFIGRTDLSSLEQIQKSVQQFVDNTSFSEPSNESPYKNFDWEKFLKGKVLLSTAYDQTSKREDQVHLCPDGTFKSILTRTGIFKDQAKGYNGKKKGKWSVKSDGTKATITFTFEKLKPVTIELEGRDEEIYIREQRYFLGQSEECK